MSLPGDGDAAGAQISLSSEVWGADEKPVAPGQFLPNEHVLLFRMKCWRKDTSMRSCCTPGAAVPGPSLR